MANKEKVIDGEQYREADRILLFFSGGLDTSFLLHYFACELGKGVETVSFNLGAGARSGLEESAKALGAKKHHEVNATKEFIEGFCFKAVKANALFYGAHPLSSSLSRPLMAKLGVELAKRQGCSAIMHGANGWQNNSARFDNAIRALAPELDIFEPIMENGIERDFELEYLKERGHLMEKNDTLSTDVNLWGREVEDGILEDPYIEPPESIYSTTVSPQKAPDAAEFVEIHFENGFPIGFDGMKPSPVELVSKLNEIGGRHGVGRHDTPEDKTIGIKMREIHESPAATMLIGAHADLERAVLPRKCLEIKSFVDSQWMNAACHGLWFHPIREQLEGFIDKSNEKTTGVVRLKLFKGSFSVVGRRSAHSLDRENAVQLLKFQRLRGPGRNYYDYSSLETRLSLNL